MSGRLDGARAATTVATDEQGGWQATRTLFDGVWDETVSQDGARVQVLMLSRAE